MEVRNQNKQEKVSWRKHSKILNSLKEIRDDTMSIKHMSIYIYGIDIIHIYIHYIHAFTYIFTEVNRNTRKEKYGAKTKSSENWKTNL